MKTRIEEKIIDLKARKNDAKELLRLGREKAKRLRKQLASDQWKEYFSESTKSRVLFEQYLDSEIRYNFYLCEVVDALTAEIRIYKKKKNK